MSIRYLVLDFDGTCTQIPPISDGYLTSYLALLNLQSSSLRSSNQSSNQSSRQSSAGGEGKTCSKAAWLEALATVRARSPKAGWMLSQTPSAPAAADPFILASEATAYLVRKGVLAKPALSPHGPSYEASPAAFRDEMIEVLKAVDERGLSVHFVSNSETQKVEGRLDALLRGEPALRKKITVDGGAAKFQICELPLDGRIAMPLSEQFEALPAAAEKNAGPGRPIYLRRGCYFEALSKVWEGDASGPASTLVCGDIWELDLAMPSALGCAVHLIRREPPYDAYPYELAAAASAPRGGHSADLRGLVERLQFSPAS